MTNRLYRDNTRYRTFLAKDLDEAHKLHFFGMTMHRDEFMQRVTKYNESLRWFANASHRALWDTDKGENGFICGITHMSSIPQYSILEYNFDNDKTLHYTNMYGEKTGSEVVNENEFDYKALARGWEVSLAMIEKQGYRVDRKGI